MSDKLLDGGILRVFCRVLLYRRAMSVSPPSSPDAGPTWRQRFVLILLLFAMLIGVLEWRRGVLTRFGVDAPESAEDGFPSSMPNVSNQVGGALQAPAPRTTQMAMPPGKSEGRIGDRILADYLAPQSSVEKDLTWVSRLLENFQILAKGDDPLPLGSNEEIVRALIGKNARHLLFLSTNHPAINSAGQLVDRWGTPLFFHALSAGRIEIRSAGPDRQMWTEDDVQRNENGTFSKGLPPR